jgi:hypothetical protein
MGVNVRALEAPEGGRSKSVVLEYAKDVEAQRSIQDGAVGLRGF